MEIGKWELTTIVTSREHCLGGGAAGAGIATRLTAASGAAIACFEYTEKSILLI